MAHQQDIDDLPEEPVPLPNPNRIQVNDDNLNRIFQADWNQKLSDSLESVNQTIADAAIVFNNSFRHSCIAIASFLVCGFTVFFATRGHEYPEPHDNIQTLEPPEYHAPARDMEMLQEVCRYYDSPDRTKEIGGWGYAVHRKMTPTLPEKEPIAYALKAVDAAVKRVFSDLDAFYVSLEGGHYNCGEDQRMAIVSLGRLVDVSLSAGMLCQEIWQGSRIALPHDNWFITGLKHMGAMTSVHNSSTTLRQAATKGDRKEMDRIQEGIYGLKMVSEGHMSKIEKLRCPY